MSLLILFNQSASIPAISGTVSENHGHAESDAAILSFIGSVAGSAVRSQSGTAMVTAPAPAVSGGGYVTRRNVPAITGTIQSTAMREQLGSGTVIDTELEDAALMFMAMYL